MKMELEFDKEMDALIRGGRGVAVGDSPGVHLDADEIAAFAENALPERSRALHMAHIADCDRCRKILSNIIALNAEAEPEMAAAAVSASVPVAAETPWYRKLFLYPNLAYVMGGLVLVLGGLIGLSVYQGTLSDGQTAISQATDAETSRGPMAPTEPQFSAAANTSANAAVSNSAMASNSNASVAALPQSNASNAASIPSGSTAKPSNEVTAAAPAPSSSDVAVADMPAAKPLPQAAAPPPALMAETESRQADTAKEDDAKARMITQESEQKKLSARNAQRREEMSKDGVDTQTAPRTQAGGLAKATPGPTRDMQQNFPNRADNTYELRSRRVGGRDFQFRNGAWYDTAYRGQATTNVRRGSDDYRKLDGGLRSIAESLNGVVVAVWGGKAYRIQ